MMQQDDRAILINDEMRVFVANNNVSIQVLVFGQWYKDLIIHPSSHIHLSGWEVIPRKKPRPRPLFLKTIEDVCIWINGKYDFDLPQQAIEHLEKLDAKQLMYQMAKG